MCFNLNRLNRVEDPWHEAKYLETGSRRLVKRHRFPFHGNVNSGKQWNNTIGNALDQWHERVKHLSWTFRTNCDGQRDGWNNSITILRILHGKEGLFKEDSKVFFIRFRENSSFSIWLIIQISKIMIKYNFGKYLENIYSDNPYILGNKIRWLMMGV